MPWKDKIPAGTVKWGLIALSAILALCYLRFVPPSSPWSPRSIAGSVLGEPKVIVKIERVDIPGPERIRIIPKEKIKVVYRDLPTSGTLNDNTASVIAVAAIPPSPDGGVALAVLRPGADNVGVGSIEYKPTAPKFFQIKRAFSAEGWYFPAGNRVGEAALVANPLRIGPIEVKAKAGIDMERESSTLRGFVGVGMEYKF